MIKPRLKWAKRVKFIVDLELKKNEKTFLAIYMEYYEYTYTQEPSKTL